MANCQTSIVPVLEENLCPLGQISTDCVIKALAITYLGLPPNSTLTEILDAYLLSLVDARARIEFLESIPAVNYAVYKVLLTQAGVAAPTAVAKPGTTLVTAVSYAYQSVGTYEINFADPILTPTNFSVVQGAGTTLNIPIVQVYYSSPTQLILTTYDFINMVTTPALANGLLVNQLIEITIDN